jgi:hypothetical protein
MPILSGSAPRPKQLSMLNTVARTIMRFLRRNSERCPERLQDSIHRAERKRRKAFMGGVLVCKFTIVGFPARDIAWASNGMVAFDGFVGFGLAAGSAFVGYSGAGA